MFTLVIFVHVLMFLYTIYTNEIKFKPKKVMDAEIRLWVHFRGNSREVTLSFIFASLLSGGLTFKGKNLFL